MSGLWQCGYRHSRKIRLQEILMNRSKIVAIITGAISILLAIAYLIIVQILDYRDMQPAPISQLTQPPAIVASCQHLLKSADS
jgi:hypothetical protein